MSNLDLDAEVERLRQRVTELLLSNNEFEQQARDARVATGKFKRLLKCAQDGWSDALDKRNEGLEEIERLRQESADFESVCMSQEGQIARLMAELTTAKKIGAAEELERLAAIPTKTAFEELMQALLTLRAAELRAEVGS